MAFTEAYVAVLNLVYRYPELVVHRRVAFPPLSAFYKHLGRFADPRLGFHHAAIRETA